MTVFLGEVLSPEYFFKRALNSKSEKISQSDKTLGDDKTQSSGLNSIGTSVFIVARNCENLILSQLSIIFLLFSSFPLSLLHFIDLCFYYNMTCFICQ